jgi:hypothetical protein
MEVDHVDAVGVLNGRSRPGYYLPLRIAEHAYNGNRQYEEDNPEDKDASYSTPAALALWLRLDLPRVVTATYSTHGYLPSIPDLQQFWLAATYPDRHALPCSFIE